MVACVSPASLNFEPSLSTLRYAQRARAIRNRVSRNSKYTLEDELAYLRAQVRRAYVPRLVLILHMSVCTLMTMQSVMMTSSSSLKPSDSAATLQGPASRLILYGMEMERPGTTSQRRYRLLCEAGQCFCPWRQLLSTHV